MTYCRRSAHTNRITALQTNRAGAARKVGDRHGAVASRRHGTTVAALAAAPMDHTVTVLGSPGADLTRTGAVGQARIGCSRRVRAESLWPYPCGRPSASRARRRRLSTLRIAIAARRTGGGTSTPGPEVTSSSIRTSVPPSWAASSTRTCAAPIGQARALSTSSRPGSASSTEVVSSSSSGHPPPNGAAGHRVPATSGPPPASGRHPPPNRCRASRRPAPPTRLQAGQTPSGEHRSRPPRTRSGTGARGCRSHHRAPAGILVWHWWGHVFVPADAFVKFG